MATSVLLRIQASVFTLNKCYYLVDTVQSSIIKIGNSKGVRILASLLKEYAFEEDVILELKEDGILMKPAKKTRQGWNQAFKKMSANQDDVVLMDDVFSDEKFEDWK